LILEAGPRVQEDLEALYRGETIDRAVNEHGVFSDLRGDAPSLLGFLVFSGYLTVGQTLGDQAPYLYRLKIPNREIKTLFDETVIRWCERLIGPGSLATLFRALKEGDDVALTTELGELVRTTLSYFDTAGPAPERFYHAFVLGLLVHLRDEYEIRSNRETGLCRCDIHMRPRNLDQAGIVLELKTSDGDLATDAADALSQIERKDYAADLRDSGVREIRALGIAFDGKKVVIASSRL